MSTNSHRHETQCDTLIIGAGLTGLLMAHQLQKQGQRVVLLEARDALGGSRRHTSTVEFFPATQTNLDLLEWLRGNFPVNFNMEVREHVPRVFDEGKWRPFAGFGNTFFQSVGELSFLSFPQEIHMDPPMEHLVRTLAEQLPVEAQTLGEVTSLQVSEGKVTEVIVNGEKTIRPAQVVFTPFPGLLNQLIEGDGLAGKNRTRLTKLNGWTSVTLELHHNTALFDDSSVQVFIHGAKEFEPVVGRIYGERSIWMTLVPHEREGEHEFVGQCIRHIKRQLKRAWPDQIDGSTQEKITIAPQAFGQQPPKGKDPYRFSEISNLWLAHHILAEQPGTIGCLEVAQALTQSSSLKELPELSAPC